MNRAWVPLLASLAIVFMMTSVGLTVYIQTLPTPVGQNTTPENRIFLHQTPFSFVRVGALQYEVVNGEGLSWDKTYWTLDGARFDDACLEQEHECILPQGIMESGHICRFKAPPGGTMRLVDHENGIMASFVVS